MKSNLKAWKVSLSLFTICIFSTMLTGCGMTTETRSDSRFKRILGHEILTKRPLRLYRINFNLTEDNTHHNITAGYYPFSETDSGEIAVIPKNHAVRFDKLRRTHSVSGGSEYLLGTLNYKGTTYPISYSVGLTGDSSNADLKSFYLSFEIPSEKSEP
jgi:hypothetical protein